jgi:hypothetical protein
VVKEKIEENLNEKVTVVVMAATTIAGVEVETL